VKVKIGSHTAEVPLEFAHLVETDSTGLTPHTDDLSAKKVAERCETSVESETDDPVGILVLKATTEQQPKGEATAVEPFDIRKAILADADVRDQKPSIVTLRKDSSVPNWSWSAPISDGLEKRATPARARLNILLDRIFGDHSDVRTEADEIVAQALADERIAIFSET